LASRCVDVVVDVTLGRVLVDILVKLRDASRSGFAKHFDAFGWVRLLEIKEQMVRLGYAFADGLGERFAKYLAFLDFNQPPGWRSITS
jgi:hypothetical protein